MYVGMCVYTYIPEHTYLVYITHITHTVYLVLLENLRILCEGFEFD